IVAANRSRRRKRRIFFSIRGGASGNGRESGTGLACLCQIKVPGGRPWLDGGMEAAQILKHSRPVPRYTSYPTAPHFHRGIDGDTYAGWLAELPAEAPLSLYIHIPFCDTLCWFCGCHMQVVRDSRPV